MKIISKSKKFFFETFEARTAELIKHRREAIVMYAPLAVKRPSLRSSLIYTVQPAIMGSRYSRLLLKAAKNAKCWKISNRQKITKN